MSLPKSSRLQFTPDLNICQILNGMWQVSEAHGAIDSKQAIAQKHKVSISNVAVRYILGTPAVAGVIVGDRLGISEHLEDNAKYLIWCWMKVTCSKLRRD